MLCRRIASVLAVSDFILFTDVNPTEKGSNSFVRTFRALSKVLIKWLGGVTADA